MSSPSRVALIIPCYNEAVTIASVVADFRRVLPEARVVVFDNNSTDGTAAAAGAAGAEVRCESQQGKGHVIRRAFADIEADFYLIVDGDGTYDAASAPAMLRLLRERHLDMVTATRASSAQGAYRPGHRWGNRVLTGLVRTVFGDRITDMLSGYRVFSRRFVKSFPALAAGFETETEFTVHALDLHMPVGEIETPYAERPEGSTSKLHTIRDGVRILRTIAVLVKEERPLPLFSMAALVLVLAGLALGVPVVWEFLESGQVPRLPRAVLAVGFVLLSFLSLSCGLILDSVTRARKETLRLAYLRIPGVGAEASADRP